jgi:hypothetical protein
MIGSVESKRSAAALTKAALLDSAALMIAAPASDRMQSKMLYFNSRQ